MVQETSTYLEFILKVYWGLLGCQIVLQKERDTFENTTLKKLKEHIDKMLVE